MLAWKVLLHIDSARSPVLPRIPAFNPRALYSSLGYVVTPPPLSLISSLVPLGVGRILLSGSGIRSMMSTHSTRFEKGGRQTSCLIPTQLFAHASNLLPCTTGNSLTAEGFFFFSAHAYVSTLDNALRVMSWSSLDANSHSFAFFAIVGVPLTPNLSAVLLSLQRTRRRSVLELNFVLGRKSPCCAKPRHARRLSVLMSIIRKPGKKSAAEDAEVWCEHPSSWYCKTTDIFAMAYLTFCRRDIASAGLSYEIEK